MTIQSFDMAIIGAGIAGASVAAAIGGRASVVLIEAEAQPGYHSTGRSAAFWSESYGGPAVQPLTTASHAALEPYLSPRGCLHIADAAGADDLDRLALAFADRAPLLESVDRADLERLLPGIAPSFRRGLAEPSCSDIDVARLHADLLAQARRSDASMILDAPAREIAWSGGRWHIDAGGTVITASVLIDAAGAWASDVGRMAGASPIAVTPYRRTVVQLRIDPPAAADLPLVMDAAGRFYFKPDAGGRLWLSPHDESPSVAHDIAAEEIDVATAIDRFEHAIDWRVTRRERAWAGLRSFAPDRIPIYGFDPLQPDFFWFAGQGGFGIQTAPAAAAIAAALLLGEALPDTVSAIDIARYGPERFSL